MLLSKPVPMPQKKVTYKKGPKNTVYVYYTLRAYRDKKGRATSDETAIGKKDIESGMLIPNSNYYKYFSSKQTEENTPICVEGFKFYENKHYHVLCAISERIGLKRILKQVFPSRWIELLTVSYYMVCQGNVMSYLCDWLELIDTKLPDLDDKQVSKIFAGITDNERMEFFNLWIKERTESEYLAYDVTSISTYSKGMDIAEWGYNRDDEHIPQINLGMYYGESSNLPVYYNVYSGSITDKTHLIFMLENTERLGIKKIRFVLDRGFITEENLRYMHNNHYFFVIPMPSDRKDFKRLIQENKGRVKKSENWIHKYGLYGMSVDCRLYDLNMNAHIFFDQYKCAEDENNFYAYLDRLETDLKKIKNGKIVNKRFTDFFNIEGNDARKIEYKLDSDKVDNCLESAGFFIILVNDLSLPPQEVLRIYRNRDVIEKAFDNLKNHLDFKRLKTHSKETTEGKVFTGFISLILQSYMMDKLKKFEQTSKLPFKKVLIELAKIKTIIIDGLPKLTTPLTRKQKNILSALDIDEKVVTD